MRSRKILKQNLQKEREQLISSSAFHFPCSTVIIATVPLTLPTSRDSRTLLSLETLGQHRAVIQTGCLSIRKSSPIFASSAWERIQTIRFRGLENLGFILWFIHTCLNSCTGRVEQRLYSFRRNKFWDLKLLTALSLMIFEAIVFVKVCVWFRPYTNKYKTRIH